MRRRFPGGQSIGVTARRIAIIGAAIALRLGASTAIASAAPDPGLSDQAAHLPVELAEALQHDLRLSPEEYLRRAELAQQLAEFADIAKVQYPDAFAGSWLDNDGRAQIGIAPGPQAAPARAAVEQAGFGVVDVAKSGSALETNSTRCETGSPRRPRRSRRQSAEQPSTR